MPDRTLIGGCTAALAVVPDRNDDGMVDLLDVARLSSCVGQTPLPVIPSLAITAPEVSFATGANTITVTAMSATAAGGFGLAVLAPTGAGALTHLGFAGFDLELGGTARLVTAAPFEPVVDRDGDGAAGATLEPVVTAILERPPQVLAVRQLECLFFGSAGDLRDPATYGLLVAVLLDKPVTPETAEDSGRCTVAADAVLGARQQASGRLVYRDLQQPIDTLAPRELTVAGLSDARGNLLAPVTRPIETVLGDGAHVFGQVRRAGGTPVPNALLDLTIVISSDFAFTVTRLRTDDQEASTWTWCAASAGISCSPPRTPRPWTSRP